MSAETETIDPLTRPKIVGSTTSPSIELQNLDSQIESAKQGFEHKPAVNTREKLVQLLLLRGRVVGRFADLVRANELAEDAVAAHGESSATFLLRARGRAAIQRFNDALADVALAESKAEAKQSVTAFQSLRAAILMGLGRYDDALPLVEKRSRTDPNAQTLADYAAVLAKQQRFQEAEAIFLQAELKFRGLSPIPLTNLYFDRATMWERAGDLRVATSIYKLAFERLPQHVHVAIHLALLVAPSEGVAMLEPLSHQTDEPDVFATLGMLQNLLAEHSGDAALERARALYEERFAKLPEAYADHAGWFWTNLGGDPKKGLAAANINIESRQTAEAYELLVAAGSAAKDDPTLCRAKKEGGALKYPSAKLLQQLQQLDGKISCE